MFTNDVSHDQYHLAFKCLDYELKICNKFTSFKNGIICIQKCIYYYVKMHTIEVAYIYK